MDRDIRMKGKGTVHFVDEQRRPRELKGDILVNYVSIMQDIYVKVKLILGDAPFHEPKEFLMPFKNITYIEWETVEE